MTSNSYPLSFPAMTSPQSDIDALPFVITNLTTESSSRNDTDTQSTHQQASIALEPARRIRHFRRSPRESATTGEHRSRPTEAAYASSDDNLSALASLSVRESSSSDSYVPSLPQLPAVRPLSTSGRRLNRDLPPLSTVVPTRDTSGSLSSPSASQAPYPHLARSQFESRFQRHRDSLAGDATTTLGRRVAAREAARALATNTGTSTLNSMSRFEGSFVQLFASIEQEFEHLRQQHSELSRTLSPDTRATPSSRRTVEFRRQLARQSREANSPVENSLNPQLDLPRRRLTGIRSVFPSRSSTMTSRSERLSLLSNFSSVQNLPTPVSTNSSRILLFEEPTSYLQATDDSSEDRRDTWSTEYDTESDRSYVVRRRLNADGEEHVHPINLEWLHEPLLHESQGTRRVAQPDQIEAVSQSRRGWARLDPDGNEIPFEQEEELERTRSEYRLQTQSSPAQTDPGFHSLQAPTTSTSLTPDDDDDRIPRVRLNSLGSRQHHAGIVDLRAVEKVPASFVEPFRPNPLPTPLEDMIWTPPSHRVKRVSEYASFAGR